MNDQRTEHLKLPLPCNSLDIDLPRIQQAFIELDQKIAALDILLSSDDITLDTLQELVAAIKAARTDVGSINTLVDAAIGLKVAISDIVNSLTDASTDKPLSAAQGKVLNERKQALLVSGENIKTVGGASLLGEGDISVGLAVAVVAETTQAASVVLHSV